MARRGPSASQPSDKLGVGVVGMASEAVPPAGSVRPLERRRVVDSADGCSDNPAGLVRCDGPGSPFVPANVASRAERSTPSVELYFQRLQLATTYTAWDNVTLPAPAGCRPSQGNSVSEATYISYELLDEGRVARIMLDRAEARNAQNRGLLVELHEAFLRAEADDQVRVVILGGGRSTVLGWTRHGL